eukprot:365226-Chlamydomonas_euryale.AAC.14
MAGAGGGGEGGGLSGCCRCCAPPHRGGNGQRTHARRQRSTRFAPCVTTLQLSKIVDWLLCLPDIGMAPPEQLFRMVAVSTGVLLWQVRRLLPWPLHVHRLPCWPVIIPSPETRSASFVVVGCGIKCMLTSPVAGLAAWLPAWLAWLSRLPAWLPGCLPGWPGWPGCRPGCLTACLAGLAGPVAGLAA